MLTKIIFFGKESGTGKSAEKEPNTGKKSGAEKPAEKEPKAESGSKAEKECLRLPGSLLRPGIQGEKGLQLGLGPQRVLHDVLQGKAQGLE